MTRKQQFIVIVILGALSTISPFSIDMYLPAFPSIAKDLNTTIENIQLSLTAYLAGIAAGQLLYGPLLDRFGRKRPLYAGLVIYVLASIGCAFTTTVEGLITMRFFQAVGGCVGMVAAQTLVRDIFPITRTAQVFSYMTLVVAVSPMIAPSVGGVFTVAFGWHSVFITLAVLTFLLLPCVYYLVPHGRKPDKSISLRPKAVLGNFYTVVKQPQFLMYAFAGAFATSAPFAFIAASPNVFMNLYGATEKEYGWIFGIVAGCIIGSSQLNHFLLKKFSSETIIRSALILQASLAVIMIVGAWTDWLGMYTLVLMCALFLAPHGVVNPNTNALALAPFTRHTGSAASLLGSLRMAMGGLVTAVVSAFHSVTMMPMVIGMVACTTTGLLVLLITNETVKYRARKRDVDANKSVINY